jgi:hypothetical protein
MVRWYEGGNIPMRATRTTGQRRTLGAPRTSRKQRELDVADQLERLRTSDPEAYAVLRKRLRDLTLHGTSKKK